MKRSAGILMYRIEDGELRVLLVHPGGPLFTKRDAGWWSIPKGEYLDDEDAWWRQCVSYRRRPGR